MLAGLSGMTKILLLFMAMMITLDAYTATASRIDEVLRKKGIESEQLVQ